eukprot:1009659-Pleurochrysis_carterae.AAC.1
MRDELLQPDNCSGQDFADKVNTLIRDHSPYISVPYAGERLGRLIIKFLPAALAGEGRALLRDLFDKNALGKESCVIDEATRLVKMAHIAVPKAVAAAAFGRKGGNAQGGAPRSGAPYELPNGKWCSKGTCHFTNDKVNPGDPCYSDPRWPGPLPDKVLKNNQQ